MFVPPSMDGRVNTVAIYPSYCLPGDSNGGGAALEQEVTVLTSFSSFQVFLNTASVLPNKKEIRWTNEFSCLFFFFYRPQEATSVSSNFFPV